MLPKLGQQPAQTNPLELPATRERLQILAMTGRLDATAFQRAMQIAGHIPAPHTWHRFIDAMLTYLGMTLVVVGIVFFFAYNWTEMHRFTKFGLIAAAIVSSISITALKGLDTLTGKASLFAAAVLTGVLLAVYGQAYQTGADAYDLFLVWAVLIAGWVFIGRLTALWMLWLILINLALILHWGEVVNPRLGWDGAMVSTLAPLIWISYLLTDASLSALVFILNAIALVMYEWYLRRGIEWLGGRWMPRAIACLALVALMVPTLVFILRSPDLDRDDTMLKLAPLLFTLSTTLILWFYHTRGRDLFIIAIFYVGIIGVVTAAIGRQIGDDYGGYSLLGLVVIGLSTTAAALLKKTSQYWQIRS